MCFCPTQEDTRKFYRSIHLKVGWLKKSSGCYGSDSRKRTEIYPPMKLCGAKICCGMASARKWWSRSKFAEHAANRTPRMSANAGLAAHICPAAPCLTDTGKCTKAALSVRRLYPTPPGIALSAARSRKQQNFEMEEMKMKKLFALLLTLALLFSLAACGGGGDEKTPSNDDKTPSSSQQQEDKTPEVTTP